MKTDSPLAPAKFRCRGPKISVATIHRNSRIRSQVLVDNESATESGLARAELNIHGTVISLSQTELSLSLRLQRRSEGERQQIWRPAHNNPASCAQISKRLVAYIEALLVLSPYEMERSPRRTPGGRHPSLANLKKMNLPDDLPNEIKAIL